MDYTKEQERAINAEGRVIVSASAGSGKTRIMIERILRLVTSGKASLLDILAVTFTNQAAAEMKERLRSALLDEMKVSTGAKRERLKAELDVLGLAQISTVHSFCAHIIKTYFYLLPNEEISPDYRILTEQEGKGLTAKALAITLEEAFQKGDKSFKRLLDIYHRGRNDKTLREIIVQMYDKVGDYENGEEYLKRAGEDRFDDAAQFLGDDMRRKIALHREAFENIAEEIEGNEGLERVRDTLFELIDELSDLDTPFEMAEVEPVYQRMPNKPKAEGPERNLHEKFSKLYTKFKDFFRNDIKNEYADEEEEREKYRAASRNAKALAALALAYGREYTRLKREANALDFDDLEHFALALLKREEVRLEVQKKYPYVFVDEYQDVNPMQETIVSLVAKDNLFLVGDEKQAIYGFRGSRSRYFREKYEAFKAFGGALPLNKNFRTASKILEAVNEIFAPAIEGYQDMVYGGLYDGNEGEIFSHLVEDLPEEEPKRSVYSVIAAPKVDTKNAIAEAVVNVIKSELGKQYYHLKAKSFRAVTYGDIAVLVRTDTTDGKNIVAALVDHGIPVSSASEVNVCEYFEVRLLIDCLKYLDNAEADIPLAAVMLSALGGFCDEELMQVRQQYPKTPSFRSAVKLYAYQQTDELSHRLNVFFRKIKRLRALAKVRTAAEVLNALLAEGLEVEIAAKEDGESRLNRVRCFLAAAEGSPSIHDFLARLKAAGEEVTFSESGGEGAVKVMTMHKAKGLEFPVVILASMNSKLHHPDKVDEVEWSDRFLFAPRYFDMEKRTYMQTIGRKAIAAEKFLAEVEGERNLLYVAMTRAKYRLHLLVKDRPRVQIRGKFQRFSDYFGDKFLGDPMEELQPAQPREPLDYDSPASMLEQQRVTGAMQIGLEYPYRDSIYLPQKSSATAILKERSEQEKSEKAEFVKAEYGKGAVKAASAEEGTAYHKFLEHYRFGGDAREELSRMTQRGILTEEEAGMLDGAQLEKIAAIPCLKALAGRRCERERTFLLAFTPREAGKGEDEGTQLIYQGAIDLLFEDENGYVIYDYKFSGLNKEELKEKYRPQIELYRDAVAKGKRVERASIRAKIINIRTAEVIDM